MTGKKYCTVLKMGHADVVSHVGVGFAVCLYMGRMEMQCDTLVRSHYCVHAYTIATSAEMKILLPLVSRNLSMRSA